MGFLSGFFGTFIGGIAIIALVLYISFAVTDTEKATDISTHFSNEKISTMNNQVRNKGYTDIFSNTKFNQGKVDELKMQGFSCNEPIELDKGYKYVCNSV